MKWVALAGLLALGVSAMAQESSQRGSDIAKEMRDSRPDEPSSFTGRLEIRVEDELLDKIPIRCEINPTANGWTAVYSTTATTKTPAEQLTIVHEAGKPNRYLYAKAENAGAPLPKPETLSGAGAAIPFARSEFLLTDLGLEFLHWPRQVRVGSEHKRGQITHILESSSPEPSATSYAKVKSWVDFDTLVILQAEAFDLKGKVIKTFYPRVYLTKKRQPKEIQMLGANGHETFLRFDVVEK